MKRLEHVFSDTSWKDRNLGSVAQAGLVNNLNDGMMWGLLPLILTYRGFDLEQVGVITAAYPAVWGIGQLFTGKMADHVNKKRMLYGGMLLQAVSILLFMQATSFAHFLVLAIGLGLGTALVYPTFLATIAAFTHPYDRAQSLGVFRFWRDLGYAIGAIVTGLLADWLGMLVPVLVIGILTFLSAVVIMVRMQNPLEEENLKEEKQVVI